MRLYANVFNSRLVSYSDNNRLRVDCQTGFRPEVSTTHQRFIVRHAIDWGSHSTEFCIPWPFQGLWSGVVLNIRANVGASGIQGDFLELFKLWLLRSRLRVNMETVWINLGCPLRRPHKPNTVWSHCRWAPSLPCTSSSHDWHIRLVFI